MKMRPLWTESWALLLFYCFGGVSSNGTCFKLDLSVTQSVENEGFHRNVLWLIEMQNPKSNVWSESGCNLTLLLDVNPGYYVNPDELSDLIRQRQISARIKGEVNVETPAHESDGHVVYIYLPYGNGEKISVTIPIHLRYQRAQITGGYGKVHLKKPSLLATCPKNSSEICDKNRRVAAPCDATNDFVCSWKNVTYQALFEEVYLFVPIGDLDDYPLVSIFTLLLGCAGCIYILSILSSAPI